MSQQLFIFILIFRFFQFITTPKQSASTSRTPFPHHNSELRTFDSLKQKHDSTSNHNHSVCEVTGVEAREIESGELSEDEVDLENTRKLFGAIKRLVRI